MKKHLYIIFLIQSVFKLFAQDPQLTQFYAAPQYLNPAFTGLTTEHRFVANYRNQWPGIRKTYQTSMAAYDYNLSDVSSGIGVFVMQDVAGTAGLTHSQAGLNYAYRFTVRKTREIRAGISASYNTKSLGFSKLTFNDQLVTGSPTSLDGANYARRNFVDLGAGVLYNSAKFWLGGSVKHLNRPNVSLIGQQDALPMSIDIHGGYRYIIESRGSSKSQLKKYFTASFNYKHELKYDQLDLGFYYFHAPINFGFWYRGIPFKKYSPAFPNNECLAILIGCEIPKRNLRIGYSYDLTISSLGINNSLGAHEVSLIYEYAQKKKRKAKRVLVTCPKF
ncbi:MAG TPA: type IX secretion system membrane protein PorP/SprF [Bacteroidia bacterium]|nr:type IX secretion system membrane protein PorP/SprF [Bacteroidia bacterium]